MFKSIEYRLHLYTLLLMVATAAATILALQGMHAYAALTGVVLFHLLRRLRQSYHQFNKNIIFLLNALDNGDYTFNFAETKLSRRERELNRMMNRIKEILSNARKEVMENEKFLSHIMESVSTGIIILNEDNLVIQINRSVTRLLGLPILTHLSQLAHIDPSLPDLFRNPETSGTTIIRIANEREEIQLSLRATPILLKGRKHKIITLNNIGSELDHREMDSWIRLIRVMTHEIMNSIAPVTSLTDTLLTALRRGAEPGGESSPLMQNTVEALQTINATTKGLITFVSSYRRFTGIPQPQPQPVSLQTLIEEAVALEAVTFEERGIAVTLHLPAQPVVKSLDATQIKQVLLNLLKNAIEAVPDERGEIGIELSEKYGKLHLDISNNGVPVAKEVLPNIFVPFFTTKRSGSGIGLSVSRYIMRLHGGTLTHFTKGPRTVFRMTFH
ncbi:MAG: GHKL domain-containing protein [Proteiniphilum sp.]|jgi:nitrogen fixation/metabolism regulation signal transduction histidine kinase|nr:GHKL domain-containing protein [Proteiniphilum sp.]